MMSSFPPAPVRHYLQFSDLSADEYAHLFTRAAEIKRKFKAYEKYHPLADRTLAMIFEKASTRTRVSFEAGMYQLGGSVVHLTTGDSQLGRAPGAAGNALDCLKGKVVAWVGDGNNMANTWLQAAELLGFTLHLSTPSGYEVDQSVAGLRSSASYKIFKDPHEACRGASLVTTDVWTSMGYEAENEARMKAFADWCVDEDMMRVAQPDALFMHCLPAHRGEEVSAEVIDGPQSVVWDEAENRMHVQKALMEFLLLGRVHA